MIYSIPYPVPDGNGWCGDCPFLDTKKEGYDWAYCPFIKKVLDYYDWYLSECDCDYDSQWAKDNPVNNEYSE
jgi:hypothetical protein